MELYYQNETLYIDMHNELNHKNYETIKKRIFKIIDDYEVDRIVVQNYHRIFHNLFFLNQMKHDYKEHYQGDFLIK